MTSRSSARAGRRRWIWLLVWVPLSASAYELEADTWARPRSAQAVLAMQPVRAAVDEWLRTPTQLIEIHYPGGETGMLWAEELRDWLVSLGIPLSRLRTSPGSAAADRLQILIRPPESIQ